MIPLKVLQRYTHRVIGLKLEYDMDVYGWIQAIEDDVIYFVWASETDTHKETLIFSRFDVIGMVVDGGYINALSRAIKEDYLLKCFEMEGTKKPSKKRRKVASKK